MISIKNYILQEEKYIESEQATAYVFEHETTKARVLVLKNTDDNKLFSIGFRTPPSDSTGVCHILEHSVLNGSKKYRTREPFMDMLKSSLQTFLNAMTYPDKTIYPVASRNNKDFENLMDLYLDAVFNPIVKEKKEIFLQEGWRYDLDDSGKLSYKGVVYNEMKGAMSTAEDQVYQQIYKNLYPGNIYSLNSGGDPYEIPNLSYEDFLDYYNTYYHPSNSYIFLYGDVDYEKYLQYIHEEYLSKYEFKKIDSSLKLQVPFESPKYLEENFSTNKNTGHASNMISYSVIASDVESSYDLVFSQLVKQVLISSESSPLKDAINKLDIVEDILNASQSTRQVTFAILGKNIREEDAGLFTETLENTLKDIVANGLDRDLIWSMLNNMSFSLKEKNDNPTRGIEYLDRAYNTWLYDISPIEGLDLEDSLERLRTDIENGAIEKYIDKKILNNPHKLIMLHKPEFGLNEKRDKEVEEKLDNIVNSLSDQEKADLVEQRKNMEEYQNREDSPQDKATIPTLELSDVNTKFKPIDRQLIEKDGYSYLTHNLNTSGIDYINFVFDINHIDPKYTSYLSMLTDMLGLLDTEVRDYKDLFTKIYLETGGISFNLGNHEVLETKKHNRTLTISTKIFAEKAREAMAVIEEIIFMTDFSNEKRLKDLINIIRSRAEITILDYGHMLMMRRVNATKYALDDFTEKVSGLDSYIFYKNLDLNNLQPIIKILRELYSKVFNRKNLLINITSDFTKKDDLLNSIDGLVNKLEINDYEEIPYEFIPHTRKEAILTSTDVSYVSIGNDLANVGYGYKGSATVISNLLSNAYLYNEIRAKAGAYGAGMSVNNKQAFVTYSYRDPNIFNSLEVFKNIPKAAKSIELTSEDLKSFIIGAVGKFDPALTEKGKGRRDLDMFLTGRKYSDFENYVKEALETDHEDLKLLADKIEESLENASYSVLTSPNKYKETKDLFDSVIDLTK